MKFWLESIKGKYKSVDGKFILGNNLKVDYEEKGDDELKQVGIKVKYTCSLDMDTHVCVTAKYRACEHNCPIIYQDALNAVYEDFKNQGTIYKTIQNFLEMLEGIPEVTIEQQ